MRITSLVALSLGLALASALDACGPYGSPNEIDFPGLAQYGGVLRGDNLLCLNEKGTLIAVDLRRQRTFDLGPADKRRWHDGDVTDSQALLIVKDRLHVIDLKTGKTTHEIAFGTDRIHSYGFAAKGQVFVHRENKVELFEIATGKLIQSTALGEGEADYRNRRCWQRLGDRLFLAGPDTTLCVIDLKTGKLQNRYSIDARAGIGSFHVEASLVYVAGARSWVPNDHLVCFDMESKKSTICKLPEVLHGTSRLAGGPYGTAFVVGQNRIDRFTMHGDCCGTCKLAGKETVLGVWHNRVLIAGKGEIRLEEIHETAVTSK